MDTNGAIAILQQAEDDQQRIHLKALYEQSKLTFNNIDELLSLLDFKDDTFGVLLLLYVLKLWVLGVFGLCVVEVLVCWF